MIRFRKLSIGMAVLLAIAFLCGPVYAKEKPAGAGKKKVGQQGSLIPIRIPSKFGSIKDVYRARNSKNPRTIVYVQDAHANYEGQKNLANIIETLIKEKGLRLILVEGGDAALPSGNLDYMKAWSTKEERLKTAEKSLREGTLSGEEYLNLISDYEMNLQGIEDKQLYDDNMRSFLAIMDFKDRYLAVLADIEAVVNKLKPKLYPKELNELEKNKKEFTKEESKFIDYYKYLGRLLQKKDIEIKDSPNFNEFIATLDMEKGIDFGKIQREQQLLIKHISAKLTKDEITRLTNKTYDLKNKKIGESDYYSYLKRLLKSKRVYNLPLEYPNLASYMDYIIKYDNVNTDGLFIEVNRIEDSLAESFVKNDKQRTLYYISKDINILRDFARIKLSPEDYDYYIKTKERFDIIEWAKFLKKMKRKYRVKKKLPKQAERKFAQGKFGELEEFYIISLKRDYAFIKHINEKFDKFNEKLAVLITGGFHKNSLSDMLRENGYSYYIVTPTVSATTNDELYYKTLEEAWNPGPSE